MQQQTTRLVDVLIVTGDHHQLRPISIWHMKGALLDEMEHLSSREARKGRNVSERPRSQSSVSDAFCNDAAPTLTYSQLTHPTSELTRCCRSFIVLVDHVATLLHSPSTCRLLLLRLTQPNQSSLTCDQIQVSTVHQREVAADDRVADYVAAACARIVTKPTPEMRQAMANAEVDDDVFGTDPTVIELQKSVAM